MINIYKKTILLTLIIFFLSVKSAGAWSVSNTISNNIFTFALYPLPTEIPTPIATLTPTTIPSPPTPTVTGLPPLPPGCRYVIPTLAPSSFIQPIPTIYPITEIKPLPTLQPLPTQLPLPPLPIIECDFILPTFLPLPTFYPLPTQSPLSSPNAIEEMSINTEEDIPDSAKTSSVVDDTTELPSTEASVMPSPSEDSSYNTNLENN